MKREQVTLGIIVGNRGCFPDHSCNTGHVFADEIQADDFSNNAADAVPIVKQLLQSAA
ncbi:hypothetical protein ACFL6Q_04225 [Candidatus Neomarinimicrobiota bacterium]